MSGATIRRTADVVLRRSPAQPVFRRRAAHQLAVLAYHGVDDPACFRRQLDLLTRSWHPVSLDDVLAAVAGDRPLPRHAVLVTFDDGDPTVLSVALPLLRERGIPAVAFVLPGLLDSTTPFWWSEATALHEAGARLPGDHHASAASLVAWLKTVPDDRRRDVLEELRRRAPAADTATPQLRAADLHALVGGGVEIGNHTWTHPCLDRCDEQQARHQVVRAHEALADVLGHPPRAFAYPNGNHDPRVEPVLAGLGYQAAFLFDHRLVPSPGRGTHPLRLSRLRVGSDTAPDRFATIVSGLHPAVHHARGRR